MNPYFPAEETKAQRGRANDLFQVQSSRLIRSTELPPGCHALPGAGERGPGGFIICFYKRELPLLWMKANPVPIHCLGHAAQISLVWLQGVGFGSPSSDRAHAQE